jgi:hypothetical protein
MSWVATATRRSTIIGTGRGTPEPRPYGRNAGGVGQTTTAPEWLHYGLVVDILTGSQAGEDVKYRMPCLAVLHACRCIRRLPCKRAPPSVIRGACVVGASRVVGPYRPAEAGYAQGRRNGIASCCSLFGIHPANPTFWVRGLDQIDSSIHGLDI